jgi:transposase
MAGKLPMGQKELIRAKIMEMVKQGQKRLRDAASILKVSYRQAKRILKKYHESGDRGLIHGNTGKRSHRRIKDSVREAIIECYRTQYPDFGPTFAAEKIQQRDGLTVDHETLRRWLLADGLWQRKRRRNTYRQRRNRRERFGELIQFDGSHHDWFEGRGPKCCLMNMIDDATGITMSFLIEEETTEAAMNLLWVWILHYGIPQALYCDRKNAFVLDREPTIEEQLAGIVPKSPFQIACDKLGINVIVAQSPQAKGRVERNHAVYQDRFVKELRLEGISTLNDANRFLEMEYLPAINKKFSKRPFSGEDAHIPKMKGQDFRNIFCFEYVRVVSNDYIVQIDRKFYQVLKQNKPRPRPGDKVVVRRWLDGSVHFFLKNKELFVKEFMHNSGKEYTAHFSLLRGDILKELKTGTF